MAEVKTKSVVRRVHKRRVCGCFTVLVFIIILVVLIVSGCHNNNDKGKKSSAVDVKVTEATTEQEKDDKFLVCIDPGHGGDDPGSNYGDRLEMTDNLRYAKCVYDELSKRDGIEVMITRTDSKETLDSEERAKMANDAGADLFLALHRNYSDDSSANGIEVWTNKDADAVDINLGYKLIDKLKVIGIQRDRGVHTGYTNEKQENFMIIEYTNMTSCILELGFISNDEDNYLFDKHYKEYSVAIADAVEEMRRDFFND